MGRLRVLEGVVKMFCWSKSTLYQDFDLSRLLIPCNCEDMPFLILLELKKKTFLKLSKGTHRHTDT